MMSEKSNDNLQIRVQTRELVHALNFALSVVEKRNIQAELNNIKLSANNGSLTIGATDADLYLNQHIGAEVMNEGEISVAATTLSDIVRKIPDEEIILKKIPDSEQIQIIGKNCNFKLPTLPTAQFPEMEDVKTDVSLTVPSKELARIIEYTVFAMSNEETRYNLNGIYLHVKDNEFCSAATDAHRLSVASVTIDKAQEKFGVILPRKTVQELLKMIKDTRHIESKVSIFLAVNKIKFVFNNIVLISKLIDGEFPEYASFIPVDNQARLTVNTKLIADAVDRVATVTVDKFRAIKLTIEKDKMEIAASGEDKGSANETITFSDEKDKLCSFTGDTLNIGFNPQYISDVLKALKEDNVSFYLNNASAPVLVKTNDNPNDSFVIMPVKV